MNWQDTRLLEYMSSSDHGYICVVKLLAPGDGSCMSKRIRYANKGIQSLRRFQTWITALDRIQTQRNEHPLKHDTR